MDSLAVIYFFQLPEAQILSFLNVNLIIHEDFFSRSTFFYIILPILCIWPPFITIYDFDDLETRQKCQNN